MQNITTMAEGNSSHDTENPFDKVGKDIEVDNWEAWSEVGGCLLLIVLHINA